MFTAVSNFRSLSSHLFSRPQLWLSCPCFSSQVSQISALRRSRCFGFQRRLALSAARHHRPSVSRPTGWTDLPHLLQFHLHAWAPAAPVGQNDSRRREERRRDGWRTRRWHPVGDHPSGVHQSQFSPLHAELVRLESQKSKCTNSWTGDRCDIIITFLPSALHIKIKAFSSSSVRKQNLMFTWVRVHTKENRFLGHVTETNATLFISVISNRGFSTKFFDRNCIF